MQLKINKELNNIIPPLSKEEINAFEKNKIGFRGFNNKEAVATLLPTYISPGYWIWSIRSFETRLEEYYPKPTAVERLPISRLKYFDYTSFRTHPIAEYPPPTPKEGIKKKNITNVYFFQSVIGGPVKIGKSNNVEQRLEELQTGSPYILQIIKIIKNVKPQVEREFHEKFKDYRSHGEWFDEKVLNLLG